MTNELIQMIESARDFKNHTNDVRFGRKTYAQYEKERKIDINDYHRLIQKITIEMAMQKVPMEEQKKVWKIWA